MEPEHELKKQAAEHDFFERARNKERGEQNRAAAAIRTNGLGAHQSDGAAGGAAAAHGHRDRAERRADVMSEPSPARASGMLGDAPPPQQLAARQKPYDGAVGANRQPSRGGACGERERGALERTRKQRRRRDRSGE